MVRHARPSGSRTWEPPLRVPMGAGVPSRPPVRDPESRHECDTPMPGRRFERRVWSARRVGLESGAPAPDLIAASRLACERRFSLTSESLAGVRFAGYSNLNWHRCAQSAGVLACADRCRRQSLGPYAGRWKLPGSLTTVIAHGHRRRTMRTIMQRDTSRQARPRTAGGRARISSTRLATTIRWRHRHPPSRRSNRRR